MAELGPKLEVYTDSATQPHCICCKDQVDPNEIAMLFRNDINRPFDLFCGACAAEIMLAARDAFDNLSLRLTYF